MRTMSDAMITAAYQRMIIKNPNITANSIIKGFKGTAFHMRRQDALNTIRELKSLHKKDLPGFIERNKNSNMTMNTQVRIAKDMEKTARKEALFKAQRKSTSKARKAKTEGKQVATVGDARDRTYKNVDASQDYVEFYG